MANSIFGNKAVVLSRVSTQEQVLKEGLSPQQNDLLQWAKEIGYSEFYCIDTAESGFLELDAREGWNLIFDYIEKHPDYKTIIATEINRIARDEVVLMYVKDYLYKHEIQLIIKDLQFWLLNPDGSKSLSADLMFNIYTSMAHFEMLNKNDRKRRALTDYRKMGYSIGGAELFGYTRQIGGELKNKKNYVINEEEAQEIRTIYNWYVNGIDGNPHEPSVYRITMECIARGMSRYLHSERNVGKCLKEEAYTGYKITQNKKRNKEYWNYKHKDAPKYVDAEQYECVYPQIISRELFEQVKELRKKRSPRNCKDIEEYVDKSRKHTTILSKLITCPSCGKYLVGEYRMGEGYNKNSYRCANSRGVVNLCNFKSSLSMTMMDSAVWSYIQIYVDSLIRFKQRTVDERTLSEQEAAILRLEENIKKYEVEIAGEEDLYRSKIRRNPTEENRKTALKEYEERIQKIEKERSNCTREIEQRKKRLSDIRRQLDNLKEVPLGDITYLQNNKEEMYRYVHILLDKVIPLYVDIRYTVLKIVSLPLSESLNKMELGEEYMSSEEHATSAYLVINKRNTNNIRICAVMDVWGWDETEKVFLTEKHYPVSVQEVGDTDWTNLQSIRIIGNRSENLAIMTMDYNKLSFYSEDVICGRK